MKQTIIPFKDNIDIPGAHLYAFIVCNSTDSNWYYKRSFYKLKNDLLKKYGHESDYDLQIIEKRCYSCDGKGNHPTGNVCWNCNKGVYAVNKVVLKRYLLNGALFHEPIGYLFPNDRQLKVFNGYDEDYYPTFRYIAFDGKIVNQFNGLIKHESINLNPTWAYLYLLFNYRKDELHTTVASIVSLYANKRKRKLKTLLSKYNPLKALAEFFEIQKMQIEPIDDLPF